MTRLLQHLRRRAVNEGGAVLVFVAVGLPMFIGFGIFVIDVGNWWVHKRHLQTQADAAALAGAREFRFPVCSDKEIVETAVDYSGGVLADPDSNFTAFDGNPLNYNHQLAASARPAGPTQGIHTQVNTPDPWDAEHPTDRDNDLEWVDDVPGIPNDGDLKDMAPANRKPCSSQMVDVKMTETDIAGSFSPLRFLNVLGFIKFIDARARAELHALMATKDTLPLAVEDLNPKRVHVWLYDEDTQTLLGDAELNPRDPEDGLLMYDNSTAGGGAPVTVDFKRETIGGVDVTKQRIGAKIAVSGVDSVDCTVAGVTCYGSAADGLTRIRGARTSEGTSGIASCTDGTDNDADGTSDTNDQDCRGVRLGAVALVKDAANCAANTYGAHDNGYFSTTCTQAKLVVDLPGFSGANEATDNMSVTADIQSGANGTDSVALHWVAADSRWETTGTDRLPIELAQGTRRIDIRWAQRRNTLDMGGATPAACVSNQNQNPCKGTFTNVHKAFSGDRPLSGPIKEVRVDVGGITNVNNVERCASNETCPQAVVVRVALAGRLSITPPDAPPVGLRISASGPEVYQTQQLNCEPGGNTSDELAYGCTPLYGVKDDEDPCPNKATLHASPNPPPWECVAVKPGTMNSVAGGLNERFLCVPPNPASNCNGNFGKPQACTSPNRYPNYEDGDPRVLTLFLVPFNSLNFAGAGDTVPIVNFAFFYVTGWHSKGGGFDNPCAAPGAPIPDVFAPGTENDSGVVSGYFIKYVAPNTGGSSDAACDPDSIGGCVAAMTK